MRLKFLTSNPGKVEFANKLSRLRGSGVRFAHASFEFAEGRELDVGEIARQKVGQAGRSCKASFVVEDTGCYIQALGGFPATHVKFALSTVGLNGILKLLKGVPRRERTYRTRSAIGLHLKGLGTRVFVGENWGHVPFKPGDAGGHGWGEIRQLLQPNGWGKTLAEFSKEEWEDYTFGPSRQDSFSRSLDCLLDFLEARG